MIQKFEKMTYLPKGRAFAFHYHHGIKFIAIGGYRHRSILLQTPVGSQSSESQSTSYASHHLEFDHSKPGEEAHSDVHTLLVRWRRGCTSNYTLFRGSFYVIIVIIIAVATSLIPFAFLFPLRDMTQVSAEACKNASRSGRPAAIRHRDSPKNCCQNESERRSFHNCSFNAS